MPHHGEAHDIEGPTRPDLLRVIDRPSGCRPALRTTFCDGDVGVAVVLEQVRCDRRLSTTRAGAHDGVVEIREGLSIVVGTGLISLEEEGPEGDVGGTRDDPSAATTFITNVEQQRLRIGCKPGFEVFGRDAVHVFTSLRDAGFE